MCIFKDLWVLSSPPISFSGKKMPETNKKQHKHICLYSVDIYQSVTKSWRSQINAIPLIASQITVTQKKFLIKLRILQNFCLYM